MQQIKADCALLEQCKVMDYSLLMGVHYRSGPLATSRRSMDGQVANFEEHNAAGDLEAEVERIQVGCSQGPWCGCLAHLLPGMVADVMLGVAQWCSCVQCCTAQGMHGPPACMYIACSVRAPTGLAVALAHF
jgi:hypothetical protein